MFKRICENSMCTSYVFGASAGEDCPSCGSIGKVMTESEEEQFMQFYRRVQES